jgi:hypothetical protein
MKVIEPLKDLKKDLGEMLKAMGWEISFHSQERKGEEASFLVKINSTRGYCFRINREGGLNIVYPETVDTSTRTHEKVIEMARRYFKDIDTSQYEVDIIKLLHFYQS